MGKKIMIDSLPIVGEKKIILLGEKLKNGRIEKAIQCDIYQFAHIKIYGCIDEIFIVERMYEAVGSVMSPKEYCFMDKPEIYTLFMEFKHYEISDVMLGMAVYKTELDFFSNQEFVCKDALMMITADQLERGVLKANTIISLNDLEPFIYSKGILSQQAVDFCTKQLNKSL